MRTPGRKRLNELLSERNRDPHSASRIDTEIQARFSRRVAILALDMCDFTRTAHRRGIIHYLAMIEEMSRTAAPAVAAAGGAVVKQQADNLFAVFPDPEAALLGALQIHRALDILNAATPDDRDIYGCIGIGFGDTLLVGRTDMFGAEVNLACKLGEDVAQHGQILLSLAAFEALPSGRFRFSEQRCRLSGGEIDAYLFQDQVW